MIRLIVVALLLLALVTVLGYALWTARQEKSRTAALDALNREIHNLAFDHVDISEQLAQAVLHRFALATKYPEGHPVDAIPADVLQLCLAHRGTDPDLSIILSDTIRSRGVTLGARELP